VREAKLGNSDLPPKKWTGERHVVENLGRCTQVPRWERGWLRKKGTFLVSGLAFRVKKREGGGAPTVAGMKISLISANYF